MTKRDLELTRIGQGTSLFRSIQQYDFYCFFECLASDFQDEDTLGFAEAAELAGLPEDLADWAVEIFGKLSALGAGIPLSVVQGKTTLRDHFPQQYIDFQCGR
jgi:hypothetical protein